MHFINLETYVFGAEMIYQTIGLKKRIHYKLGLNNLSSEERVLSAGRNREAAEHYGRGQQSLQPSTR